jgi:hypothetical protein
MKNSQLINYMVSLDFIDFISWGVLDNGPLYCITLWDKHVRSIEWALVVPWNFPFFSL